MTKEEDLTEEVFCLKFELNTLADQLLRQSSERWVPGFLYKRTEFSHTERYNLACEYTTGKKIIDIACGVGRGSNIMATYGLAESVYGTDIQPDTIRYAKWRYGSKNIEFAINDAQELDINNEYDVAVSFETIEHVPDYRKFLIAVNTALKSGGLFLVSTPISSLPINTAPDNPYHLQEWGFYEFQDIIKEFFKIDKIFVQLYPAIPILEPVAKSNLLRRIINKISTKIKCTSTDNIVESNVNLPTNGFSKIEEFTGQYPVNELGILRQGYQIVIARKNE